MWFFYNSYDKVSIEVDEITRNNMTITIKDTNEVKYKFSKGFLIFKNDTRMSEYTNSGLSEQYFDNENQKLKMKLNWYKRYGELEERTL